MKIKCPFCTFNVRQRFKSGAEVKRVANRLRYHLQYDCPIHNVGYVEDYL